MRRVSVVLMGFGNVGQAVARLLLRKAPELEARLGWQVDVTGIATGRHGRAIDTAGINLTRALELVERGQTLDLLTAQEAPLDGAEFIVQCRADALLESTPVNHHTGQPAIHYLETALHMGMHAVTANKGPVVHGYDLLMQAAAQHGKRFLFESAVMDGAPVFSLFRGPLPLIDVQGFFGVLNSSTNVILESMEQGDRFDHALRRAQALGVVEADPDVDIDGWDAALKVAALSTVVLGVPLTPQQVQRQGIREIDANKIAAAARAGMRWKLVGRATRYAGGVQAQVAPEQVGPDSPMYAINGSSSYVQFESDVLPGLGIVEHNPGLETTAYGMLADLVHALRES